LEDLQDYRQKISPSVCWNSKDVFDKTKD
jgi:hypothetical protein